MNCLVGLLGRMPDPAIVSEFRDRRGQRFESRSRTYPPLVSSVLLTYTATTPIEASDYVRSRATTSPTASRLTSRPIEGRVVIDVAHGCELGEQLRSERLAGNGGDVSVDERVARQIDAWAFVESDIGPCLVRDRQASKTSTRGRHQANESVLVGWTGEWRSVFICVQSPLSLGAADAVRLRSLRGRFV